MELAGENKNYPIQMLEHEIERLKESIQSNEQQIAGWEKCIHAATERVEDMRRLLTECTHALDLVYRVSGK